MICGVEIAFAAILHRAPEPAAADYWSQRSTVEMVRGIAHAPEAATAPWRSNPPAMAALAGSIDLACGVDSPEAIIAAIRHTFPESPDRAVAIARCESSLNPRAVGPDGGDLGLMQVRWSVHRRMLGAHGISRDDLLTIPGNLVAARLVFDESVSRGRSGWVPWVCDRKV